MMNAPSVQAELTLLAGLEHPRWPNRARYMPHIVIGDPQQREARMCGNTITERYLGVLVADAPDEMMPGKTDQVTLCLMYWPEEKYDDVKPGATFTLREGPKIVGFGQILSAVAWPGQPGVGGGR